MHNILYRTYPENTRQVQIVNNVLDIVRSNGDGYGTDRIQFLSDAVCDSREDAEAYIEQPFFSSFQKGRQGTQNPTAQYSASPNKERPFR